MTKVLGLGDNVADYYLHTNTMYPGGNTLNFAAYASLLGYQAGFLGVFGDDGPAAHVYNSVKSLGVDLSHCRFVRGENGLARVTLVEGERRFLPSNKGGVSRQHQLDLTRLDDQYIQGFDLVHSSWFGNTEHILPHLRELGVALSFDLSHLHRDDSYLQQVCPHLIAAILSCGDMEETDTLRLMERTQALGPRIVLATRGVHGALLLVQGELYRQSPCLVQAIDTLGAGDSFLTAFLCTYIDGMKYATDFPAAGGSNGLTNRHSYEQALIQVCLHKAAVFAAESCLSNGAFGHGAPFQA